MWHLLDAGSIWMKEFAAALGSFVPLKAWIPEIRNFGWAEEWERETVLEDPSLRFRSFPLQRGYARSPIRQLYPFGPQVVDRLLRSTPASESGGLICTSPFYAPVAERWPGPVIYYLTDLTAAYDGMNRGTIQSLDRRLCDVAGLVCPNSRLIGEYLQKGAGCDARKVLVVPNATRSRNVLEKPSDVPADLPADLADLPRPVVGVIGNLASNLDWHLIRDAIEGTTDCSWAFVGPIDMKIAEPDLQSIRCELIERKGRIRFIGSRPYGELHKYARAFDVALLPYRKKESTFAGSATRYYEHLAACRPILATPAVDEILSKEPMLKLVTGGAGVAMEIERLRANGFRDSWESLRWRVSREETWEVRAQAMLRAAQAGLTVLQNKSGESAESSALQGAHGETYP